MKPLRSYCSALTIYYRRESSMLASIASPQEKLIPAWLQPVLVLDLLAARGIEWDAALSGTALFVEDLPLTERYINVHQYNRFLENGSKLWPTPDFAFLLGHQIAQKGLGPLRDVLSASIPCERWLKLLARYNRLWSPGLSCRLFHTANDDCFFQITKLSAHARSSAIAREDRQLALHSAITTFCHLLKHSSYSLKMEVYFSEAKPKHMELFHAHIPARCHFSAPFDGVKVNITEAGYQDNVVGQDTSVQVTSKNALGVHSFQTQVAIQHCEKICCEREYLLPYLTKMLWALDSRSSNLLECASHLTTSPATLKRRLQEQGLSFQQLSDYVRADRAIMELLIIGTSVEQIGERLQYHDSSNFRRAFKRWTGMTPKALRLLYQELFEVTG